MWAWAVTAALASFGALASCGAKICELAFGSDSTNFGRAFGHVAFSPKAAGLQLLPFAVTSFKKCWPLFGERSARALTAVLASFGALASCGAKICELAFGSDSTNFGRAFGHSLFSPKAAGLQSLPFAVTSFKKCWRLFGERSARAVTAALASFGVLASFGAKICELAFGSDSTNFGRAFGHSLFSPKSCRLAVTALRCDELRGGSCAGIFLGRLLPLALKFVNSPSAQTAQILVAPSVTRFFPQKLQACSHCPSL